MGNFCKPVSQEKQIQFWKREQKRRQDNIAAFNKKYEDKGDQPPLWESEYLGDGCVMRRYPDGHIDFHYRHTIEWVGE